MPDCQAATCQLTIADPAVLQQVASDAPAQKPLEPFLEVFCMRRRADLLRGQSPLACCLTLLGMGFWGAEVGVGLRLGSVGSEGGAWIYASPTTLMPVQTSSLAPQNLYYILLSSPGKGRQLIHVVSSTAMPLRPVHSITSWHRRHLLRTDTLIRTCKRAAILGSLTPLPCAAHVQRDGHDVHAGGAGGRDPGARARV